MNTKDLFSSHADQYAAFRPDYPQALYDFILHHVHDFQTAWDCATGNGQAAKTLSQHFNQVQATDISERQMMHGYTAHNIHYAISPAEQTTFADNTFDLITVAQAAHWLSLDKFYKEVKRVGKPASVLAIWGYGLLRVNPEFDLKLNRFYKELIGPYWDPERKHIDTAYQSIPFPFQEINSPAFTFSKSWTINQMQGYLSTWSAVQKYIKRNNHDPVADFIADNRGIFGEGWQEIQFPLFLRLGKVEK